MHIQIYRQFENQLRLANVPTVAIPERTLAAVSLGKNASSAEVDDSIQESLRQSLPPKLFSALADFQKVGVHWGATTRKGRCLICDEVKSS